jgi:hypothetical protein
LLEENIINCVPFPGKKFAIFLNGSLSFILICLLYLSLVVVTWANETIVCHISLLFDFRLRDIGK